jgi:Ni2+-binding GTPase involved in maturation of urease and hydrogenase
MGILSGNPVDEPMHYGEVFSTWTYLLSGKGMIASYQTLHNHAGDHDLKKLILEIIDECQEEMGKIEQLLKENSVALPPTPPERSKVAYVCIISCPEGSAWPKSIAIKQGKGMVNSSAIAS